MKKHGKSVQLILLALSKWAFLTGVVLREGGFQVLYLNISKADSYLEMKLPTHKRLSYLFIVLLLYLAWMCHMISL